MPADSPVPLSGPPVSEEHPELFHYTSIRALRSFLETNTIWATHTAHLNDTSEMNQIVPRLQTACVGRIEELAEQERWESPMTLDLARAFGAKIHLAVRDALLGNCRGSARVFVASFSAHRDCYIRKNGMLSQWRGYGGPDGVAIVFDTKRLEGLLAQEGSRFHYLWCGLADVVYNVRGFDLGRRFRELVRELDDFVRNLVYETNEQSERIQNNRLVEELPPAMARVKHRAFLAETECRIVVVQPSLSMAERLRAVDQTSLRIKSIHHRPGHQGSVPYIRLFEDHKEDDGTKARLPIIQVIVGPSRNQGAHMEIVEDLVAQHRGTGQIVVSASDIPFVGSS